MAVYSSRLFAALEPFSPDRQMVNRLGLLDVAISEFRMADLVRLGEDFELRHRAKAPVAGRDGRASPLIDPRAMVGALFIAEGQTVAPAHVSGALQRRRCDSSGANRGHRFRHRWRKVEAVLTANPDNPRLHCDHAVIMTNIWAPVLGDKLGVPIPLMGYEHQYLRTGPLPELNRFDPSVPEDEIVYPSVRELDTYIYFRQHWNTFGVGSYRRAAPGPCDRGGEQRDPPVHPGRL